MDQLIVVSHVKMWHHPLLLVGARLHAPGLLAASLLPGGSPFGCTPNAVPGFSVGMALLDVKDLCAADTGDIEEPPEAPASARRMLRCLPRCEQCQLGWWIVCC